SQREKFTKMQSRLFDSMITLAEMSMSCYDAPRKCPSLVAQATPENHPQITFYQDKDFDIFPEEFAQYCDLALDRYAKKTYTPTIKALINIAHLNNPDLFKPDGWANDICYYTARVLQNMVSIDLSFDFMQKNFTLANEVPFPMQDNDLVKITSIKPLQTLTHLREINLSDNRVRDLESLTELKHLERLNLSGNDLDNISSLIGLTGLSYLNLSNNELRDLLPLITLTQLRRLDVSNNRYALECPFN